VIGVSCEDYKCNGAFAEFIAVPERILFRLPDNLKFEHAAMVEALSIAFHTVDRTKLSLNDTAVVVGSGMIGLLVVQSLRLAGCGRIIAVDVDQDRLDLALELGADVALNPEAHDVQREVFNLTGGRGADTAFEVVGIESSVKIAASVLKKGGGLTLVGNLSQQVGFPLQMIVTREITVNGSCASCGEYPSCLDMIARGKINVDALLSTVAPLNEGAHWFDRLYKKDKGLLKVVLVP